jgi:hypothetical protein
MVLTKMRERHAKLPLTHHQVSAGAVGFAPCHKKWQIPCHSENSLEISQMHYMASQAALESTKEDLFHNAHLYL